MSKVKPWSRRELNSGRRRFLLQNARRLLVAAATVVLGAALVSWLLLTLFGPDRSTYYAIGVVHAGLLAVLLFVVESFYIAYDGEAIKHVRGAWGEDNTRDVLRAAQRRRLIWGSVDSIDLQFGDIDHLVVTRSAGVLAVDSKWWSEVNETALASMAQSARRAAMRAQAVLETVLTKEVGVRHRARTRPLAVQPVVVVWGSGQRTLDNETVVGGVPVVPGREFRRWLSTQTTQDVDRVAGRDAVKRLERYRDQIAGRSRGPVA